MGHELNKGAIVILDTSVRRNNEIIPLITL